MTHAYGGAGDVPPLVCALYDPAAVDDALYELHGNVWHQGTVYPATAAVVPFLAHAAMHGADPAGVLGLLTVMADQDDQDLRIPVVAGVLREIAAAAGDLLGVLRHPDGRVRSAYAELAATLRPPLPDQVIAELSRVEAGDPNVGVRSDALAALSVHHPNPEPREAVALSG